MCEKQMTTNENKRMNKTKNLKSQLCTARYATILVCWNARYICTSQI